MNSENISTNNNNSKKEEISALLALLAKCSTQLFEPTLSCLDHVKAYVKEHSSGNNVVHPWKNQFVFFMDGQIVVKDNIIPPDSFKSCTSMGELEQKQFRMMKQYDHLVSIRNYSVNILFANSVGMVPLRYDFEIFTITEKIDHYFDLVAYQLDGQNVKSVDYNNKTSDLLQHSGDIGYLLHHIKANGHGKFVLGTIGFRQRPLRHFTDQHPMVTIVGEDTINIVPCPLDVATVGNATFSALLLCEIVNKNNRDFLKYFVLPKPQTLENIDTGCTSLSVFAVVSSIINEGFPEENIINDNIQIVDSDIVSNIATEATSATIETSNESQKAPYNFNCIQFVQNDIDPAKIYQINSALIVPFGRGIGETQTSVFALPCIFGPPSGHQSILLGQPYQVHSIPSKDYYQTINKLHVIVHTSTHGWDFFSSNSTQYVGNCIFIIHLDDNEFENVSSTDMHCLTMAGPRALVLYENKGKYFFYRGVKYPGFGFYVYGDEVKFNPTEWIESMLRWDTISPKKCDNSYVFSPIHGQSLPLTEMINQFDKMDFSNTDQRFQHMIIDILVQMSVVCESAQLTGISSSILSSMSRLLNNAIYEQHQFITQCLTDGNIDGVKQISTRIHQIKQEYNKKYKYLLEFINNELVSVKGCVSKNHSLERVKRKNDIKMNVAATLEMTTEDLVKEVTNNCENHGVVISNLDGNNFLKILCFLNDNVKKTIGYYDPASFLSKFYRNFSFIHTNDRCSIIDRDTYECLAEVSKYKMIPFSGSYQCCMLPLIATCENECNASLPIPLFDDLVDVTNPYSIDWHTKCNDAHIAHFRIALRNTFIKATCSRDLNIPVDNVGFGAMMCIILLEFIEKMVSRLSTIPDDDSTMLYTVRGLLGFVLTFMASGANSQLKAWEIFKTDNKFNVPPNKEVYDVYIRLLKIIPYARWDTMQAVKNMRNISNAFVAKLFTQ